MLTTGSWSCELRLIVYEAIVGDAAVALLGQAISVVSRNQAARKGVFWNADDLADVQPTHNAQALLDDLGSPHARRVAEAKKVISRLGEQADTFTC